VSTQAKHPRMTYPHASSRLPRIWRRLSRHPKEQAEMAIFRVTDRLHRGRTAYVPGDRIVATVSAWLAELGAESPLVDDLARAVCAGNWSAAHGIAEYLSVEVAFAA
jgi:hypothetical protein